MDLCSYFDKEISDIQEKYPSMILGLANGIRQV
jgi:hypothetical protein